MNSATESKLDRIPEGVSDAGTDIIDVLRRFHYGEPSAAARTVMPNEDVLPALLNPYRDASAVRYQYPLYLFPPDAATQLSQPLGEFLSASVDEFALGAEDARILRDNLPWIERYIRQQLEELHPVDAPTSFEEAAAALQDHLGLDKSNREKLGADLNALGNSIAEGGQFLGYGPYVSLHLLLHAVGTIDSAASGLGRTSGHTSRDCRRCLKLRKQNLPIPGNRALKRTTSDPARNISTLVPCRECSNSEPRVRSRCRVNVVPGSRAR